MATPLVPASTTVVHGLANADPIGVQAEVAETRVHVHVQVDQPGRDEHAAGSR